MTLPNEDTLDTYGGALADYESPVVDPETDRAAAAANRAFASMAMATRTQPRAWCVIEPDALGARIIEHNALWGAGTDDAPTATRESAGVYVVTWPELVHDALGEVAAVSLRRAWYAIEGVTALLAAVEMVSPTRVRVRVFGPNGLPLDPSATNVVLFVR